MAQPTPQRDSGLWILVALVLLVVLIPAALMMGFWGGGMMGPGTWAGGGWGGWLAMAFGAVVLVLVIVLVLRAIQSTPHVAYPTWSPPTVPWQGPETRTAIQIPDARYAKGEITRDEYMRMRADLENRTR